MEKTEKVTKLFDFFKRKSAPGRYIFICFSCLSNEINIFLLLVKVICGIFGTWAQKLRKWEKGVTVAKMR